MSASSAFMVSLARPPHLPCQTDRKSEGRVGRLDGVCRRAILKAVWVECHAVIQTQASSPFAKFCGCNLRCDFCPLRVASERSCVCLGLPLNLSTVAVDFGNDAVFCNVAAEFVGYWSFGFHRFVSLGLVRCVLQLDTL